MNRVLVFVHGAGKFPPDYAAEPLAQISQRLGWTPPAVSVYYADVVGSAAADSPVTVASATPLPGAFNPPGALEWKMAFAMQVYGNLNSQPPTERSVGIASIPLSDLAGLLALEVNEIAGYLFDTPLHDKIQDCMREGLDKGAAQGDELVVVAHSLGSLIAFDALKAVGDQYRVATFMTLGCPLSILRRIGTRGPELGRITRDHIGDWLNFYDTTDPLSNVVGPYFPLPGYRPRDVFVDVGLLPPASHDYMRNPECLDAMAFAVQPPALAGQDDGL